jgi:hypothetical protein
MIPPCESLRAASAAQANAFSGIDMTSHFLPTDQYRALVDALLAAHDDLDPENTIKIALAEVGGIVPDTCLEDAGPASLAAAA